MIVDIKRKEVVTVKAIGYRLGYFHFVDVVTSHSVAL